MVSLVSLVSVGIPKTSFGLSDIPFVFGGVLFIKLNVALTSGFVVTDVPSPALKPPKFANGFLL